LLPDVGTLNAFGLTGQEPVALPYGEGRSYKVGAVVLKDVRHDAVEVVRWAADLHAGIGEDGFRIARPVPVGRRDGDGEPTSVEHRDVGAEAMPVRDGGWVTEGGWLATRFIEGGHDYRQQVPACIGAIERYHLALKAHPRPAFFDTLDGPFRRADRDAFGERPDRVHPELAAQIDALYALRRPLVGLGEQLIHGDLNPSNLLIADGLPPGIIDIAPYWRPAGFALAVFAYWIGPWRNRPDLLDHFAHVDQFDQLLVRAGLRMLLYMSESGQLTDMAWYARATGMIVERLGR
jgi:hypothetical protein